MRRLLVLPTLALALAGCGNAVDPPEGCKGHEGVQHMDRDATNGYIPFVCKDGTVGRLEMGG